MIVNPVANNLLPFQAISRCAVILAQSIDSVINVGVSFYSGISR